MFSKWSNNRNQSWNETTIDSEQREVYNDQIRSAYTMCRCVRKDECVESQISFVRIQNCHVRTKFIVVDQLFEVPSMDSDQQVLIVTIQP